LKKEMIIEVQISHGTEILPVVTNPEPGISPEGFRIISAEFSGNCYEIFLESSSGTSKEFEVYINDKQPVKIENAELVSVNGNIYKFVTEFPVVDKKYVNHYVKLFF